MDKVTINVHAFFTVCQDFILDKKYYYELNYYEKMRHRRRKRRRGQFTAVTMADLMSWSDSDEKWRIDGNDVVVVTKGYPKLLKEEVSWLVFCIEQRSSQRAVTGFVQIQRDILASLKATKGNMGQMGKMLSAEEQKAQLVVDE